jgi:glycosyltransferase involved in cell wall biosynthesis
MKLTIAIPTWNRALRLEKALIDLCTEINLSSQKYNIEVFVSNNGSVDETANVIMKCGKLFTDSGILFTTRKFEVNKGFDANIISCYVNSKGDYTWFLSDDDNIISGAIDAIFKDIFEYSPSVIFYNFEQ